MKLDKKEFQIRMEEIIASIRETGLEPYAQLSGYLRTGNEMFITRHGNARAKIRCLDDEMILEYLKETPRKA